jgi:hypothetical protein
MIISDLVALIAELSKDSEILSKPFTKFSSGYNKTKETFGRNSIKNRTKDLILQYPLLASSSISSDTVQMCAKALEHEYVNILTVLINSQIQTEFSEDEAKDTQTFLKRYHTNIYKNGSAYVNETSEHELTRASRELLEAYDNAINLESLNEMSYPKSILEAPKKITEKIQEANEEKNTKKNTTQASFDTKKMNDMSPTLVKAMIKVRDNNNVYDKPIQFGVKCVTHPLDSEDIIYYLSDTVRDNSKFFRLIQWTTGEIKFFRDLVASLDSVKRTAINATNKNTFWWRKLKSMSQDNLLRRLMVGKKGTPIPTATLLISKQDVDAIKNRYSIDILNTPKHADTIMKKFFLLGFVIVDEASQIAYLYNEVSKDYDYYTFNALKKAGKEDTSDMDVAKSLMGGRK